MSSNENERRSFSDRVRSLGSRAIDEVKSGIDRANGFGGSSISESERRARERSGSSPTPDTGGDDEAQDSQQTGGGGGRSPRTESEQRIAREGGAGGDRDGGDSGGSSGGGGSGGGGGGGGTDQQRRQEIQFPDESGMTGDPPDRASTDEGPTPAEDLDVDRPTGDLARPDVPVPPSASPGARGGDRTGDLVRPDVSLPSGEDVSEARVGIDEPEGTRDGRDGGDARSGPQVDVRDGAADGRVDQRDLEQQVARDTREEIETAAGRIGRRAAEENVLREQAAETARERLEGVQRAGEALAADVGREARIEAGEQARRQGPDPLTGVVGAVERVPGVDFAPGAAQFRQEEIGELTEGGFLTEETEADLRQASETIENQVSQTAERTVEDLPGVGFAVTAERSLIDAAQAAGVDLTGEARVDVPGIGQTVTPALVEDGEGPVERAGESFIQTVGGPVAAIPGAFAAADTAVEIQEELEPATPAARASMTPEERQEQEQRARALSEAGVATVAETLDQAIASGADRPVGAVGSLAGEAAIAATGGAAIERTANIARASRVGGPRVDLAETTTERGAAGESPLFETGRREPTREAVEEVRERAADQPEELTGVAGEESLLLRSEAEPLPEEFAAQRGQYELPGLFASPDLSPLRLPGGSGADLSSLRPRLPQIFGGRDQVTAFPGERIEGMPASATGARRVFPDEGEPFPDPTTSGARFLEEEADPGTAFVRPTGSRTTELEAIFPPGSEFVETGEFGVRLPGGRVVPGRAFRRAETDDEGDVVGDFDDADADLPDEGAAVAAEDLPRTRVDEPDGTAIAPTGLPGERDIISRITDEGSTSATGDIGEGATGGAGSGRGRSEADIINGLTGGETGGPTDIVTDGRDPGGPVTIPPADETGVPGAVPPGDPTPPGGPTPPGVSRSPGGPGIPGGPSGGGSSPGDTPSVPLGEPTLPGRPPGDPGGQPRRRGDEEEDVIEDIADVEEEAGTKLFGTGIATAEEAEAGLEAIIDEGGAEGGQSEADILSAVGDVEDADITATDFEESERDLFDEL